MATTLNKTILKEFQATNFKSFSDGQISIEFPYEDNLTRVHVVLTPTGGLYKGGTFKFTINLPENYPESVASITCQTKIFHPNIDFSGYICFNILSDEWNTTVRLVDYAHALLWLLYQPNLGSRLNGAVPNDETEYAQLVTKSLQGQLVGGVRFEQMIPYVPEPEPGPEHEREQRSVARLVALFNAPRAPPPPPLGFRMRIPTTTPAPSPAAAIAPVVTTAPIVVTAPAAPPAPAVYTTTVRPLAHVAATPLMRPVEPAVEAVDPREAEAADDDEGGDVEAVLSLKEETEDKRLRLTSSALSLGAQRAGQNQEKHSARKGRVRLNKRRRAYARETSKPQPSRA